MSAKTYRFCTLLIVIALAAVIAWSVVMEMPVFLPIGGVVIALLLIRLCRRFTREIMVDERISRVNEKAAAISYRIFSIAMAILGVGLIVLRESLPPTFGVVGETLVYSVCVLMLIHLTFYYYYGHRL
jgi:uncharacterized membrane protein